jgi:Ca2+-binding EF-hand superfamily protein
LDNDGKISFEEFAQIMSVKLDKLSKDNMQETLQLTTDGD